MNIKSLFNKGLGYLGRLWFENNQINWLLTVYFNLRQLPLNDAIKLPVYIYFNTRLVDLSGKINISCPIKRGMIRIGKQWTRSVGNTYFQNLGTWNISGNCLICKGTRIAIMPKAVFCTENNINIRECCYISVNRHVKIKRNSEIAYSCQILDSDFHYMINTDTRQSQFNKSEIVIGENNWLGSYTTVKKGTKTPNGCIVASSYSVLCKDYTKIIPENAVIGGVPAKLIARNVKRVFNLQSQAMISNYYYTHGTDRMFVLSENEDLNTFCNY